MNYIIEHMEWIFSGIGVFILSVIFNFIARRDKKTDSKSIKIKSKGSKNKFNIEQK